MTITVGRASLLLLLFGCGLGCQASYDAGHVNSGGGEFSSPGGPTTGGGGGGVDTGGAQDIAYARATIQAGQVPQASAFTVEGLLSEHDVAAAGPPCESLLCLRPAVGTALSLETGKVERWVHLGMTTGLDLSKFQRPPTDLVVAIDKSASMSIDLAETATAVNKLIDHMRPQDRLAVLAFDDDVHVLQELGPVTDKVALQKKVSALTADGRMLIDTALVASYGRLYAADPARLRRVVVLSCGYPTISPSGEDETSRLVREQGAAGIGLTMVGVLLGWDANLAGLLGKSNGANYYYLSGLAEVMQVFDQNFDHIVTPLAYDLELSLATTAGFTLERMYGIPGDEDGKPASGYTVATAFPSTKRGSLVARLGYTGTETPPLTLAKTSFSYRPEPALGWSSAEDQSIDATAGEADASGSFFGSPGVRKAVALVNEATQLIAGCEQWHAGKKDEARATIKTLLDHLTSENATLHDPAIDGEIQLVDQLLAILNQ